MGEGEWEGAFWNTSAWGRIAPAYLGGGPNSYWCICFPSPRLTKIFIPLVNFLILFVAFYGADVCKDEINVDRLFVVNRFCREICFICCDLQRALQLMTLFNHCDNVTKYEANG